MTSDGLGVFGDEGVDSRLCENPDGLIQPAYDLHGLESRGRQTQSRELFLNEGGENPTEQAVFGDQLMNGSLLRVSQLPQFLRFRDDRSIRSDGFVRRCPDISGHFANERGNMIE